MRRSWKYCDVYRMRGKNCEVVSIRGDNKLPNIIRDWSFNNLESMSYSCIAYEIPILDLPYGLEHNHLQTR